MTLAQIAGTERRLAQLMREHDYGFSAGSALRAKKTARAFWFSAHPGAFQDVWWLLENKLTQRGLSNALLGSSASASSSIEDPLSLFDAFPEQNWKIDYNGVLSYHKEYYPWLQTSDARLLEIFDVIHDHSMGQWGRGFMLHREETWADLERDFLEIYRDLERKGAGDDAEAGGYDLVMCAHPIVWCRLFASIQDTPVIGIVESPFGLVVSQDDWKHHLDGM